MQPRPTTRRRWSRVGSLLIATSVALAAVSCTDSDDGADPEPEVTTTSVPLTDFESVLRLGVTSDFEYDPARVGLTEYGQMMGLDLLYDTLVSVDPATGEPASAVAAEWDASDGFTTWTFTIREGAAFSDGTPITASDVKFSLERLAALDTDSLAGVRLEVIKGYDEYVAEEEEGIGGLTVEDDATLVITTSEAFAPLPELLSSPVFGILPQALVEEDEDFFDAPVGSGPLMLASSADASAAVAARPDGSDDVALFVPAAEGALEVDAIELVRFSDIEGSYQAFVDGAVDWSQVPSAETEDAVETYGDGAVTPFHAEFFYGINVGNPKYADLDFRTAILRAIDREAIVEEHFPRGIPLNGTVVEGVPGFEEDPCGDTCAFDPEVAESLLADAFPDDDDVPTVNLDFYEGDRELAVAEAIAENLEAVGIPTQLRPQEGEYEAFVTSSDQEVFLFGWVGIAPTADSYLAPLFLTGSPDNVTAFSSEAIDAGIAAARAFETREERAEAYAAVESSIMAEAPIIPLVQVRTLAVVSDRVTGWLPQMDGTFVVSEVELSE